MEVFRLDKRITVNGLHGPSTSLQGGLVLQLLVNLQSPGLREIKTGWRYANQRMTIRKRPLHESTIRRILPNSKPWAGGAPSLHRFLVGAFLSSNPLQEIED
jgi:hypothetical protein